LNAAPHMVALQAAIDASRGARPSAISPALPAQAPPAAWRDNDASAMSLLWRIRTRLTAATPGIVQFAPCAADGSASAVAHGFARAAAMTIGRTLLINAREAATGGPLPDAYVPRLYHQCISGSILFGLLAPQQGGLCVAGGMFSVIVLDQPSPLAGGGACITAPLCSGTILTVDAGATDLASIKSAAGRITSLGGAIFGAVLAGVPSWVLVQ